MQAETTWQLDSIFPTGLGSPDFSDRLANLHEQAQDLVRRADALPDLPAEIETWEKLLLELEEFGCDLREAGTYVYCRASEKADDREALAACARTEEDDVLLKRAWVRITDELAHCEQAHFEALVSRSALDSMRPYLEQVRIDAPLLLPRAQQALAKELARDALISWGQLYERESGKVSVLLPDGETLSAGQASNLMGSQDREVRETVFSASKKAWGSNRDTWAASLTHIVGFRQVINDLRGVDELADSLAGCRMEKATLDAMMQAIAQARPLLLPYLEAKARLLGVEKLGWEDLGAPVGGSGPPHDWNSSIDFILENFQIVNPDLHQFAERALGERWVEAENRSNKRQGGWCAWLPRARQSRIFMTHGGEFRSTITLAHELGHAYHNEITKDLAPSRRRIPMQLAETASTFAENLVRDAALKGAQHTGERLEILDTRLRAAVAFLMNIPARFSFERSLYRFRRDGILDPDRLDAEMLRCQKEAYGMALSSWDPTFWSSKLHFYIAGVSFYNYPYSFGYLFYSMVCERIRSEGSDFEPRYIELLRRSGWENTEDLAQDILGVDLRDPAVWTAAMAPIQEDLNAFLEIAAQTEA